MGDSLVLMGILRRGRTFAGARALFTVIDVAAFAFGVWLLTRPLSAVLALSILVCAAAAVCGVLLVATAKARTALIFAGALSLLLAVFAALHLPVFASSLPVVAAIALCAAALRTLVQATAEERPSSRFASVLFTISLALLAMLSLLWPDVSTLVIGVSFALALIVFGLSDLVRLARRRPRSPTTRSTLRATGAIASTLVVSLLAAGSLALVATSARADDFYEWKNAVPKKPGEVLRTERYDGELPAGSRALKVLYSTTYSDGSPALASAVVAYPSSPAKAPRPVLSWQHGTTGVAQACGPSVGTQALTEYAIPGIQRAIDRGWVVVATDYPGQGTAGKYPYLIGEGEGRATLDGIRAVRSIADAHASSDAWVWGHSQGGHATLWAGQIAASYAPDIHVRGVAALSAAAEPFTLAERVVGASSSSLGKVMTSLVLVPYSDEYPDVTLDASVHPAGHGLVKTFAKRCVTDKTTLVSVLVGEALKLDAPLYDIDMSEGPTRDRLLQNGASGLVPAPLFLGQGVDDEVIPITVQRTLREKLCTAHRTVEAREYPGRSHMGVIAEGSPLIDDLFSWADAVEQGTQPQNCEA